MALLGMALSGNALSGMTLSPVASGLVESEARQEPYAWPGDSLLSAYISEALAGHPEVLGEEAMVKEARARERMASSWMNPMVVLGVMDAAPSFDLNKNPMTEKQVGLMQTLPWPGKFSLGKKAARQEVEGARENLDAARWRTRTMVAMAYFRLAGLLQEKEALEETLALADEALTATGIALSSGMESQANFVQARVERTRSARELVSLQSQIDQTRVELAQAIGRTTAQGLADPELPSDLGSLPEVDGLIAQAQNGPTLKAMRADSIVAYLERKQARLAYFPDITVGARYGFGGRMLDEVPGEPGTFGWMNREGRVSIELSFPIPLWAGGNQNAQIAERTAHLERTKANLANERIELLSDLQQMYLEAQSLAQQFKITRDSLLVPARMAYRAAIIDYRAGRLPWMNLNNVRMSVSMLRMEAAMEAADYLMKKAEIEGAIGKVFP